MIARCAAIAIALLAGCSASDDIPSPSVSAVQPDHATIGTIVVVTGSYFCQRPAGNEDPNCDVAGTVLFGTSPGTPTTWMDTAIMVEVPPGIAGTVDVSVSTGAKTSNSVSFTVD